MTVQYSRKLIIFFKPQITGLIAGLIYLQIPYNQDGIQNIAGVYFFLVTSTSFSNLQGVIFVSIREPKLKAVIYELKIA